MGKTRLLSRGEMIQAGAVQTDSESGSEHELQRSDRRTGCLTGGKASRVISGFLAQVPGGEWHLAH